MIGRAAAYGCLACLASGLLTAAPTTRPAPATRPATRPATKPASKPATRPAPTHDRRTVEGWTLYVNHEFQARHATLCETAVREAAIQLRRVARVVPEDKLRLLRGVPIRLEAGPKPGGKPGVAWHNGLAMGQAEGIEIAGAESFLDESRRDAPWVLLRELTRALDWKLFRYNHAEIKSAFETARKSGRFDKVLHADGHEGRHHALADPETFFAEFSVAYFGRNNAWPFIRAELEKGSPEIARLVHDVWHRPAAFTPTARYQRRRIEGWTVLVHPDLPGDHPAVCAEMLGEIESQLHRVRQVVPADKLPVLQETRIWVEFQSVHESAAVFHPYVEWLRANGMNPEKADGIELGNAEKFLEWSREGLPWMIFHELCHSYDWRIFRYGNPRLIEGWKRFVDRGNKTGVLKDVLHFNGTIGPHNGRSNNMEYFAEFSESWFGRNEMHPFVRAQLEKEDPATAALIREIWFSPLPASRPTSRPR